jgi:hypothetical protein
MAAKKYLSKVTGITTEIQANDSSAGAGDAGKLVALNASGVLAASIVNSVTSSAGAGDTGKIVALDAAGKIDSTMMPTGVGADTKTFTASETLAAGDIVNIWDDSGTPKVRKADASGGAAKAADGFVLSGFASAATATVYFDGTITGLSGLTGGTRYFLSGSSAGTPTATAVSTTAYNSQTVGKALSSTELSFEAGEICILA